MSACQFRKPGKTFPDEEKDEINPLLPPEKCLISGNTSEPREPDKFPKKETLHLLKNTPILTRAIDLNRNTENSDSKSMFKEIILGMGCFWCSENVFMWQDLKKSDTFDPSAIYTTIVGYSQGETIFPSYEDVCTKSTNHTEVVRIVYDENKLSLENILKVFFNRHDPTTWFRQGPEDFGSNYRGGIYYEDDDDLEIILRVKKEMQDAIDGSKFSGEKIFTEIEKVRNFYPAETYHQQYRAREGSREYCGLRPLWGVRI